MPLQEQIIAVPFGVGLDTKTDKKLVLPGRLLTLQNAVFGTGGTLQKRLGTTNLGSVDTSGSGIYAAQQLASYNSELDLFGQNALYAYGQSGGKWSNRGAVYPIYVGRQQITANQFSQTFPDGTTLSGVTVFAYQDSRGGVRITVVDEATGSVYQNDLLISSSTGALPRCIASGSKIYVLYTEPSVIKYVTIDPTQPAALPSSPTTVITDRPALTGTFEAIAGGNYFFVAYVNVTGGTTVAQFNTSWVVQNTMTIANAPTSLALVYMSPALSPQLGVVYSSTPNQTGVSWSVYNGTTLALITSAALASNVSAVTGIVAGPIAGSNSTANVFYQTRPFPDTGNAYDELLMQVVAGSGNAATVFERGAYLAAYPFTQAQRVLLPVLYSSATQATYFLIDVATKQVVAKCLQEAAGPAPTASRFALVTSPSTSKWSLPALQQGVLQSKNGKAFTTSGVTRATFDWSRTDPYSSAQLGQNLHISGGIVSGYDGNGIVEHGFHVYPEAPKISLITSQINIAFTPGSATTAAVATLTFPAGKQMLAGDYVTWEMPNVPSFAGYYAYFAVDGVGSDPALPPSSTYWNVSTGGLHAKVNIKSTDTAAQVAQKFLTVLNGLGSMATITLSGAVITMTYPAEPAATGFKSPPTTSTAFTVFQAITGGTTFPATDQIMCSPGSVIGGGQYWTFETTAGQYYVWYAVSGSGPDPAPGGFTAGIRVDVGPSSTGSQVATQTATALSSFGGPWTATAIGPIVIINKTANGLVNPPLNVNVGGGLGIGSYSYSATYEWTDAAGQLHVSAPSVPTTISNAAAGGATSIKLPALRLTAKTAPRAECTIGLYRTENNGAIQYKTTSPTAPIVNNPSVDQIIYTDVLADSSLISNQILYTTGSLAAIAPPPCYTAVMHRDRIFLAGLEDKNLIYFSNQYVSGNGVLFNDALSIRLDPSFGAITALCPMDDKLIIFKHDTIWWIGGDGPNALGIGAFTDPQLVATDIGCTNQRSVVLTPNGILFQSTKGICLLSRQLQVEYLGAPVDAFSQLAITSATILPGQNQVRFTSQSPGTCLVWDYFYNQWGTFTGYYATSSLLYNGTFYACNQNGIVRYETAGSYQDNGVGYPMVVETAWLKLSQIQGFWRARNALWLGFFPANQSINLQIQYDYNTSLTDQITYSLQNPAPTDPYYGSDATYGSTSPYGGTQASGVDTVQWRAALPRQKLEAIKFTIQDLAPYGASFAYQLTSLNIEAGMKRGIYKIGAGATVGS